MITPHNFALLPICVPAASAKLVHRLTYNSDVAAGQLAHKFHRNLCEGQAKSFLPPCRRYCLR